LIDNLYFDLAGPVAAQTIHYSGRDCFHIQLREIDDLAAPRADVNTLPMHILVRIGGGRMHA